MSSILFSKNKLKSKKTIDLLFAKGKYLKVSGYSLVYIGQPNKSVNGLRVGFSVGKKSSACCRPKQNKAFNAGSLSCLCKRFFGY